MKIGDLPRWIVQRSLIRSRQRLNSWWIRFSGTRITDPQLKDALKLAETETGSFLDQLRARETSVFFIDGSRSDDIVGALRKHYPDSEHVTIQKADLIRNHIFDLLGSGPVFLGEQIDWHADFKSGHHWDPDEYYAFVRAAPYPGGYDIRVPWELSRCHHFVTLGQAYWYTGDERYAQEFVSQIMHWDVQNPPQLGVNWACSMEVAIRAVNWIWGYYFFRNSPSITEEFIWAFHKSLLAHGRHIFGNLENEGGFTNNHYLSNLVGLIYLGIMMPFFLEAEKWLSTGVKDMWAELSKQVYPDGVSFEASIAYHRFATELYISVIILCQLNNIDIPEEVMDRLGKMLDFVMHYTKPDGTAPFIGDNDNGRLHRLKIWSLQEREWSDHRYLLAIGAVLLHRKDFAVAAGDQWEEAFWLLGERAIKFKEVLSIPPGSLPLLSSKEYPHGGVFVLRDQDAYMIVDAGQNGQNGRGGHGHNDTMSFVFATKDGSWIIDPGTYVYTADYEARELFRSTAYHNTPYVTYPAALEQNVSSAHLPFRLQQDTSCSAGFEPNSDEFEHLALRLSHYGGQPITLERSIIASKVSNAWIFWDRISEGSNYAFEINLHLAHDVQIDPVDAYPDSYMLSRAGSCLLVHALAPASCTSLLKDGWISPSYGVRWRSSTITYQVKQGFSETGLAVGLYLLNKGKSPDVETAVATLVLLQSFFESNRSDNE